MVVGRGDRDRVGNGVGRGDAVVGGRDVAENETSLRIGRGRRDDRPRPRRRGAARRPVRLRSARPARRCRAHRTSRGRARRVERVESSVSAAAVVVVSEAGSAASSSPEHAAIRHRMRAGATQRRRGRTARGHYALGRTRYAQRRSPERTCCVRSTVTRSPNTSWNNSNSDRHRPWHAAAAMQIGQ